MFRSVSLITLGVEDLARSKRFYIEGFGWVPHWEQPTIVFYQLNGFLLGTYPREALSADVQRPLPAGSGSVTLAHNVATDAEVAPMIDALVAAGGTLVRAPDAPPWGGLRGYLADPDGHLWEVASTPGFKTAADGTVTFAA